MSLLPLYYDYYGQWQYHPASFRYCQPNYELVGDGNLQQRCIENFSREPEKSVGNGVWISSNGFEISINVCDFKPEEISVKTIDNHIVFECKHEEREDENGDEVFRHFRKKYVLPKQYDITGTTSALSRDLVLTIKAPFLRSLSDEKEHVIEIKTSDTDVECESVSNESVSSDIAEKV